MKVVDYMKFPVRTCRTQHTCALCQRPITLSDQYYDAGAYRKAHVTCVWPLALHTR